MPNSDPQQPFSAVGKGHLTPKPWQYIPADSGICELAYDFFLSPSHEGTGGTLMNIWAVQVVRPGVTTLRFGLYRFYSAVPVETIEVTARGVVEE